MSDTPAPMTEELKEDLSDFFAPCPPPPAEGAPPDEDGEGLSPQLASLVREIEPPRLREFMRGLFADITRLLGHVESVKTAVESGAPLDEVTRAFEALNKPSFYLLTNVEMAELRIEEIPDALIEKLEAAGFALGHELKRVFRKGLAGEGGDPSEPQLNLLRACALLENCYQQLTVALASSFDGGASGLVLFESYRRRREQSLTLRAELRALLDSARVVEQGCGVLTRLALLRRLRRFRYECLHYLMYRDWEDFERLADAIELSYESAGETTVLAHNLSCYVEALLSQVEMRAVLAEGAGS